MSRRVSVSVPCRMVSPMRSELDRSGHGAGQHHGHGPGVAAAHQQRPAHLALRGVGDGGQPAHVVLVRHDGAVAGQVGAHAGQAQVRQTLHGVDEGGQVLGHDALAQIAQLHHGQHVVGPAQAGGRGVQSHAGVQLGGQRQVEETHRVGGQPRGGHAQQPQRRRDAGLAQPLRVLVARLGQGHGAARQHGARHRGGAAHALGDGYDVDAAQHGHHGARVVLHAGQVDEQPRPGRRRLPAVTCRRHVLR